jgi:hypothetical protein
MIFSCDRGLTRVRRMFVFKGEHFSPISAAEGNARRKHDAAGLCVCEVAATRSEIAAARGGAATKLIVIRVQARPRSLRELRYGTSIRVHWPRRILRSVESKRNFGSRFQRYRFWWAINPGALPQALVKIAPVALTGARCA